ncbi:glycosyl hydrolases family 16 [Lentimicrobium saccharophilum]|uniref:Glycosyl hydrolases family 16 n=1 Tax=Lentimicrobium saccharophilum TaxID=1678841 RepID=A0A0S7C0Y9_9BACT|nr:glycoside hydrolase family 16 protein [Lentimicrobium saccharophilum]GAP42435.1 glycosyl hydrolases family 16 [Lentimicrobium saccharophilum]
MRSATGLNVYFLCLLVLAFLSSCSKDEKNNTDTDNPSNLVVEVTIPIADSGLVLIEASAENAAEYQLFIEPADQPAASNVTGKFEYVFTQPGTYELTVRAYGASGRFIAVTKVAVITDNDPVTVEDGYLTPMQYPGYQLVWNDEFAGNTLNTQFWSHESGAGGWGNNELQHYRSENTSVDGGVLTIEARKESYQGSNYTSSRLITRNKKTFTYGRVDIRALLPKGQGIWPALWTLGNNITSVGWPACGEIDIMEMIGGSGREKTVHGTVHWDNNGHNQTGEGYTLTSGIFADEYHVFTIIWDENSINWYVNDTKFNEVDITPAHMSEFHLPHFFIFNVAVGGNWPGNPNATTTFPQQLKVDYIRVFQKT